MTKSSGISIGIPSATGLVFRLIPREDALGSTNADGSEPFLTLASGALPYRVLLARLEHAGQVLVPVVALLVEPNEYASGRAALPPTGNEQVERTWREALRGYLSGVTDGVAAPEWRGYDEEAGVGRPPVQQPVAWCRKTGEYVQPVCPSCLGRLTVCRDEALLRRSGLPGWRGTLNRFLYCAACAAEAGRGLSFYTFSLRPFDPPAEGVRIRRRGELARDLAPRVLLGEVPTAVDSYCFRCEHRATCYPAGRRVDDPVPAEALLYPLIYTDSHFLPVEPLPFTFEETSALLGGATREELAARATPDAAALPLRQTALERLGSEPQFFFAGDPTGLMALEALFLKLAAAASIARGVRDLHQKARRPHLALSPERFGGTLSETAGLTPIRWGVALRLLDLVSTAPLASLEAEAIPGEPTVWSAPFPLNESMAPEEMTRNPADSFWMRLAPTRLDLERQTDGRTVAVLAAEVLADGYRDGEHGAFDLVRLASQAASSGPERIVFAGRKVGSVPRGFLFEGRTAPLPPEALRRLESDRASGSWSVEAMIVRTFGEPADILSLGLLLLRLLLVNDRQSTDVLQREAIERIVQALLVDTHPPTGDPAPVDETSRTLFRREVAIRRRLAEALNREGISAVPEVVLFREADRVVAGAAGNSAVPGALWEETLLLALRMASNRSGFSICARQDDYDATRPGAALTRVVDELDLLVERARGALMGASGRNRMVLEVCADFLADLHEAAAGQDGTPVEDSVGGTVVLTPGRSLS